MTRWVDYLCMTCHLEEERVDKSESVCSGQREIEEPRPQKQPLASTSQALSSPNLPTNNLVPNVASTEVCSQNAISNNIDDELDADLLKNDVVSQCGLEHGYINLNNAVHEEGSSQINLFNDERAIVQSVESQQTVLANLQPISQMVATEPQYFNLWAESPTLCSGKQNATCVGPMKGLERENRPPPLQLVSNYANISNDRRQASLDMPLPTRINRSRQNSTSSEDSKDEDLHNEDCSTNTSIHCLRSHPALNASELNYLELDLPVSGTLLRHTSSSDASPATFSAFDDMIGHEIIGNHDCNQGGMKVVEYREIDTVRTAALHSVAKERH